MRPANETPEERIVRKARELRHALISGGVVWSPDPTMPLDELPEVRREKWMKFARVYVEIFG